MIVEGSGWYVVPATVKAVVCSAQGSVLLARNERDEWELPGGWPTRDDLTLEETIEREVAEEAAITVTVHELLHAELAVIGGHQVVIVAFRCSCEGEPSPSAGDEHSELSWFPAAAVPELGLPQAYEAAIALAMAAPV